MIVASVPGHSMQINGQRYATHTSFMPTVLEHAGVGVNGPGIGQGHWRTIRPHPDSLDQIVR